MFRNPFKSSSYGPGQQVSADNGWMVRTAPNSSAGVDVRHSNVMGLSSVFACLRILSDTMAWLPVEVVEAKNGTRTPVGDHPLNYIMNHAANDYMTSTTFRGALMHHSLLWGTGFFEKEMRRSGEIYALWPLLPDRTAIRFNDGKPYYGTVINGRGVDIDFDKAAHLPGMSFDGFSGYSLLQVAGKAMGLGIALETFASKFFANDAKSGGFLLHPGKLSGDAKNNVADGLQSQGGLDKAHRVKVLEEGMKFVATTVAPEDSQFLQSRDFQIADVARFFGVPLHLLQSMEKSTSWGSGLEEQSIAFLTHSCTPWIRRFEQMANHKLLTRDDVEKRGLSVKINLTALLRANSSARKDFYSSGILNGWMTRNEVRALEDLNPLPGLDAPLMPVNMTDGTDATKSGKAAAPTGDQRKEGVYLDD